MQLTGTVLVGHSVVSEPWRVGDSGARRSLRDRSSISSLVPVNRASRDAPGANDGVQIVDQLPSWQFRGYLDGDFLANRDFVRI